jgi:hypothetical protein
MDYTVDRYPIFFINFELYYQQFFEYFIYFFITGTKYTMSEIQTFNAGDFQIMIDEINPLARTTMLP